MTTSDLREVVGVRLAPGEPLKWYRAAGVSASVESWVVVDRDGREAVGQVVVGQGQCLSFPGDAAALPPLVRAARPDEVPAPFEGAGKRLLDSLPL